jgi:hypothetical protein
LTLALDFPALVGTEGKTTAQVKKGEARKRFGKLMVSQTAAKGVELLFNELMRILHPKPSPCKEDRNPLNPLRGFLF